MATMSPHPTAYAPMVPRWNSQSSGPAGGQDQRR